MKTRICLWLLCSLALVTLGIRQSPAAEPKPKVSQAEIKKLRQRAANRQRRVMFDNDGNDAVFNLREPSVQQLLDARTSALAGTQVDTLVYCTGGCAGMFTHLTQAGQLFTCKADHFVNNKVDQLAAKGIDPLQVMVEFGHQHEMEVFSSFRMNDTHDRGNSGYGLALFQANRMKNAHPEYLLDASKKRHKYGGWSGLNFALPEVQDAVFPFFEEVCTRYDVDGISLDFFRHPVFFKGPLQGTPATADELQAMTDFVTRIRRMADLKGRQRGRPILISMRVPDSVPYCRAIGLDLEHWLSKDLLDLLVVGSYFQVNEWETSVALGHKFGVKVYPSLDEPRVRSEMPGQKGPDPRFDMTVYRARAATVWAAKGDGIYIFNQFNPHSPIWRELGDYEQLNQLDKTYYASYLGVGESAGGAFPHGSLQTIETLCPLKPKTIYAGDTEFCRLNVAENLRKTDPSTCRLKVSFDRKLDLKHLVVKVNGKRLKNLTAEEKVVAAEVPISVLKPGKNQIQVGTLVAAPLSIKWTDAWLEVRH